MWNQQQHFGVEGEKLDKEGRKRPRGWATAAVTQASMTIVVRYRPNDAWWHRTERFPGAAEEKEDGTWIWDSVAQ
jgi:hypothetical protein